MQRIFRGFFEFRDFAVAGGLMSFDPDIVDAHRAKFGDLPIHQPTRFNFVLNLKTAKALGITIPPMLLSRADEVIE